MTRSAILAAVALAAITVPVSAVAQTPPPPVPAKSTDDQVKDIDARVKANAIAREAAERKCDLVAYRALISEALAILNDSNRLTDASFKDSSSDYKAAQASNYAARQNYDQANKAMAYLERICPKGTAETDGVGAVQSATPAVPTEQFAVPRSGSPLNNLFYYSRWAQIRYGAHSQAAANCDLKEMERQRSLLRTLVQLAKEEREKAERRGRQGKYSPQDVNQARGYEQAIQALYAQALGQGPINCPKTGTAIEIPPPQPPAPPTKPPGGGQQQCPSPGSTAPEHSMRFVPSDQNSQTMLAAHNRARADVGVPPLIWDRELADGAAAYASQLSSVGAIHAPRAGRKCVRENLSRSARGSRSPEQTVNVWVSEKRYFKPGLFPDVSTTGDWQSIVHYTQIVWQGTTHVGCARHSDAIWDWTVCRYSPPGNQDGRSVYVLPSIGRQPLPQAPVPVPYSPPPPPEPGG